MNKKVETKTLGEIGVEFLKGKGLSKDHLSFDGSHFGIHYGQLFTEYGAVIEKPLSRVNEFLGSFKSKTNDVLMPTSDVTPNGLAKASSLLVDDVILGGDILVIRAKPQTIFGPYLSYVIRNSRNQIKSLVSGTTVYHIYGKDMSKFSLYLPTYAEQEAIAATLSDIDTLISEIVKEISKNELIHSGTKQRLLTGSQRVVSGASNWAVKKLAEITNPVMGQSPSSISYNRNGIGLPLVQGQADIESGFSIERTWTTQPTRTVPAGTTLMSVRAPVGAVSVASGEVCLGRGMSGFLPTHVESSFLKHLLRFMENRWSVLQQGSTFTAVNKPTVSNFEVYIPTDLKEQELISSILNSQEELIVSLRQSLAKYEWIKQGMMHDLLSGKVRLA